MDKENKNERMTVEAIKLEIAKAGKLITDIAKDNNTSAANVHQIICSNNPKITTKVVGRKNKHERMTAKSIKLKIKEKDKLITDIARDNHTTASNVHQIICSNNPRRCGKPMRIRLYISELIGMKYESVWGVESGIVEDEDNYKPTECQRAASKNRKRSKKPSKVRRYIADLIGKPYESVWGVESGL